MFFWHFNLWFCECLIIFGFWFTNCKYIYKQKFMLRQDDFMQSLLKLFFYTSWTAKTRTVQKPGGLEVTAGSDAKFTCSGTTDFAEIKNLRISWLKDNKPITTNDQRMTQNFQDNSLTISGTIARDSGTYTCVVSNGLDNATAGAILTVKGNCHLNDSACN